MSISFHPTHPNPNPTKKRSSTGIPLPPHPTDTISAPPRSADPLSVFKTAHVRPAEDVVLDLGTSEENGLSGNEARRRLERYGVNVLRGGGGVSAFGVLIRQLANALTAVLIAAMALSFGVQDYIEGGVIAAAVLLNTTVGFFQEYRAEKTMDSLRQLSSPTALVIRNGESRSIPASDVVLGDVVMIRAGDVIPSDLRLLMASGLEVSEQLLTGESLPVTKTVEPFNKRVEDADIPIGDRTNLCFSSTVVTKGRGTGVTIGTGMNTQIGRIADIINARKKTRRNDEDARIPFLKRTYERLMKISGLRTGTPLQLKLTKLAYLLLLCATLAALLVFSVARFHITSEVILYAIAAAISIIPESLIALLSLTMAVGTRRMAAENVIVRRLDAVENLGGVTDVCSDKTGTLTLGQMSVRKFWVAGDEPVELTARSTQNALEPYGEIVRDDGGSTSVLEVDKIGEGISQAVRCAALCNVATIHQNLRKEWKATGDPTEIALQVFATKLNLGRSTFTGRKLESHPLSQHDAASPTKEFGDGQSTLDSGADGDGEENRSGSLDLVVEFPFSSEVKMMTMVFRDNSAVDEYISLTKGSVEKILNLSTSYIPHPEKEPHTTSPLSPQTRESFLHKAEELAAQGLRVISLAQTRPAKKSALSLAGGGPTTKNPPQREDWEKDMTFLGLAGIFDPPRPETRDAVRACKRAGIVVHMLTGDHLVTARAIAEAVEILPRDAPASAVMGAVEFDRLTDAEVDALPELPLVLARCAPETKVKMVLAGARRGKHLAMTGDGVNDSPALKLAPVGIGMGMSGSDVAKDASDLVLTNDNFDSIRVAINEGRRLFTNIQRFILHLLATNVAEIILLIVGLSFLDDDRDSVFPLSPVAILWTNMLTGSFPAFGLGMEPAEHDLMERPPHSVKVGVFSWPVIFDCLAYGIVMGATCLVNFVIVVYGANDGDLGINCNRNHSDVCRKVFKGRSTAFATLVFEILLFSFELKSFDRSVFALSPNRPFYKDLWANKVLFWAVIGGMASVFLPIYIPGLNTVIFYQGPIGWELSLAIGMSIVFVVWCEVWKILRRRLYPSRWRR